ncbi:MAG: hypothetical protein EPO08_19075 [Rhodospirillaceae bacterium]|nr:MAG: hypothetical protein EPO08_19075 [Rhodospirillaceae bacterium]
MTRGTATADRGGASRELAGRYRRARASALLLSAFLLAACATTPPSNQTAMDPRNGDGLGGTGISSKLASNPNGDGLGGTGIVGTISGFGSIIVNGLELEFDRSTAVGTDGRPAALDELRIGQVIQGVAHRKDGRISLESLDIQHAVTGPIAAIDTNTQAMTVLGQTVRLNLAGDKAALEAFRTLRVGDVVSVSGLRDGTGAIVATRVDEQNNDGRMIVRGEAGDVSTGHVRIGGLDVPLAADATVSKPTAGERVFVSGRMINGAFVPDVITGGKGLPFDGGVSDVSLEGYVPAAPGPVKIQGATIDGAALPAGVSANDRIVVTGRISAPDQITATAITKIRTVVTIMKAHGSQRPSAVRPDAERPERVVPERPPERPESVTPERPDRPVIERPSGMTGV